MAVQGDAAGQWFSSCVFAIVPSNELHENLSDELSSIITAHGGEVIATRRNGSFAVAGLTHIISDTIDFPEFTEAQAMMVPVVTHRWVRTSVHKGKLAQLRPFSPDPRMFLSQVNLTFAADIPLSDREAITGAVMAMGGTESENLSKLTTHICALSTENPKCQQALDKKLKCKIVLPHWFDDCFKLGKRIDERPYELPDPEILRAGPHDDVKIPSSQHLQGATSATPDYLPAPPGSQVGSRPALTVFKDRKIMLSWDLSISSRLKSIIEDLISGGGGEPVDAVDDCDMFICQFREGPEYIRASQVGKDVGNLSWLYHLITQNAWTSPLRRLLHYPIPRNGIPGFVNLKITVSNYGGEARVYLENLITACGAQYTKTMKSDNTHLITARNNSEKCDAARDWNIHMINHLWIEESYAKCEMQSLTVSKYTHFPMRTNLGEVIGQTFLDESRLHALYYPGGPEKPSPGSKRKRKIADMAQGNAYPDGPAEGVAIGRQAQKDFEVMPDADDVSTDGSPEEEEEASAPAKRRATDVKTPARAKHLRLGKENETPSTVSSAGRSAKSKAFQRLHDLAPDIALYEKEKKRTSKDGHGPWGGKRAATLIERENDKRKSLSSPGEDASVAEAEEEEEDDEAEGAKEAPAKRSAKKAKSSPPELETRVILTGFKRWVNDKHREDADRRKLRELGISVVSDGQPCDYLIAPQLVRTVKFLRNLAKGATVLSSTWVEECLDTGKVPDPNDHLLKDRENEKKFGLKLQDSVKKARKNNGKLLWKTLIFCTASIKNGTDSYKAIAEANGAIFMVYGARSGSSTIKPTRPGEEEEEGPPEPVYLLSTTSPDEKKLWKKFEDMARKGNMEPRIVASDWLLDVVMKQELSFDERYLVENFFD